MKGVVADSRKENEELTLTLTRREYVELIETLKRAEELSTSARQNELDFRMQRIRFERKFRESTPPSASDTFAKADTKLMSLDDIHELMNKPRG